MTDLHTSAKPSFIHSVDKGPFVSGSWEFYVFMFMHSFLFSSVLPNVLAVASGQTAVLPWFHRQMLKCTMRLYHILHPAAPAERQFTSAYYPKLALRCSADYTS